MTTMTEEQRLKQLTSDPGRLSRGSTTAVDARAERRDLGDDDVVHVVIQLKAPSDGRAWDVDDVMGIREALTERARAAEIEQEIVVSFTTDPTTGDAQAFPDEGDESEHDE